MYQPHLCGSTEYPGTPVALNSSDGSTPKVTFYPYYSILLSILIQNFKKGKTPLSFGNAISPFGG
jgi:hypothetical protein